jgi:hypothetical protein
MLRKHMAAGLFATALAAAPAFAQQSSTPSTDRPAAASPGSTATGSSSMQPLGAPAAAGQFMTQIQPDQIMASKIIGTTVVSANNESIGDVNDVIVDRSGRALAVVIGVGGFLGIGEKDVAVAFSALEFASREQANQMTSMGRPATGGGDGVSTTGSTSTSSSGATGPVGSNGAPDRVILRMTKSELQAAPTFHARSHEAPGSTGMTGGSSLPTPQSPPKQ